MFVLYKEMFETINELSLFITSISFIYITTPIKFLRVYGEGHPRLHSAMLKILRKKLQKYQMILQMICLLVEVHLVEKIYSG